MRNEEGTRCVSNITPAPGPGQGQGPHSNSNTFVTRLVTITVRCIGIWLTQVTTATLATTGGDSEKLDSQQNIVTVWFGKC